MIFKVFQYWSFDIHFFDDCKNIRRGFYYCFIQSLFYSHMYVHLQWWMKRNKFSIERNKNHFQTSVNGKNKQLILYTWTPSPPPPPPPPTTAYIGFICDVHCTYIVKLFPVYKYFFAFFASSSALPIFFCFCEIVYSVFLCNRAAAFWLMLWHTEAKSDRSIREWIKFLRRC